MYSLYDSEGNLITARLDERIAMSVAHELADNTGRSVWLGISETERAEIAPMGGK